jgi:hypothetical protein
MTSRQRQALKIIGRVTGEEFWDNSRDQWFKARSRRAHDAEVDFDAFPGPEVEAFPRRVGGFVGYDWVVEAESTRDADTIHLLISHIWNGKGKLKSTTKSSFLLDDEKGEGMKRGKNIQKTSTEDDEKANALAFRELHIPYHVHREDIDVNISNSVRKAVDKECGFRGVAGCAVGIPIRGYWVALLIPWLAFSISLAFWLANL